MVDEFNECGVDKAANEHYHRLGRQQSGADIAGQLAPGRGRESQLVLRRLAVVVGVVLAIILGVALLGWLGLQVSAASLPVLPEGGSTDTLAIPEHLPAPVKRYAHAIYGATIPVVGSAIVQGRGRLAPTGPPMPCQFRFYYDAGGSNYYHHIRVTWLRLPVLNIHERLLNGSSILDLAVLGRVEDNAKVNRAAVQGYWAEVLGWIPSIVLLDPRVTWQQVESNSVKLLLPGLDDCEAFTVRFDPGSGLLTEIETMRYQNESSVERTWWRNRVLEWDRIDGVLVATSSETQWGNDTPWARWKIDHVVLNADVSARLSEFGGGLR